MAILVKHFLQVCGVSLLLIFASCQNTGNLVIINSAAATVLTGTVEICQQTKKIKDLKPYEKTNRGYKVRRDSHYLLRLEISSGVLIDTSFGYVTSGLDFFDTFIIKDDGVVLVR
ncbi:MAG: hypothetical protein ACQEQ4_07320 [Fibrobacterota bacterium]